MKLRTLTLALVATLSVAACAQNVLVFWGGSAGRDYLTPAATNLGYTVTTTTNSSTFGTALAAGGWDLIAIETWSPRPTDAQYGDILTLFSGGTPVINSSWALLCCGGTNEDALATAMGFTPVSPDINHSSSPRNVFVWDSSHPVWTTPNALSGLTNPSDAFGIDGQFGNTTGGATAIGGGTAAPATNQAGIIVSAGDAGIHNGPVLQVYNTDQDADGKIDAIEIYENQMTFLLAGGGPPAAPAAGVPALVVTILLVGAALAVFLPRMNG